MSGFFENKEKKVTKKREKVFSCDACGLFQNCHSPKMRPYGNFQKGIMTIGEYPSESDDRFEKPWQGRSGKKLESAFAKLGIDLFEDCINLNAIACRPTHENGSTRLPTNFEIDSCRRFVLRYITQYQPKLIILLGNFALQSIIGYRWKKNLGSINKWRGWTIPDQDFQTWICPVFHPNYINEAEKGVEEVVWMQDLKQAFALLEYNEYQGEEHLMNPFPVYEEPVIHYTDDLSFLENINSKVTFDFETTSLKPHAMGHRIICCAVAVSADECYVFRMPKSKKERKPFIEFLADATIPKIAQNFKFEHIWSQVRLGVEVQGWEHDTMIMSHILDNREGITSLKFQTFVQFGISDYASEITPYLIGDSKNANSINKIQELLLTPENTKKLLHYCALDAIFEYRLYEKQQYIELLPF